MTRAVIHVRAQSTYLEPGLVFQFCYGFSALARYNTSSSCASGGCRQLIQQCATATVSPDRSLDFGALELQGQPAKFGGSGGDFVNAEGSDALPLFLPLSDFEDHLVAMTLTQVLPGFQLEYLDSSQKSSNPNPFKFSSPVWSNQVLHTGGSEKWFEGDLSVQYTGESMTQPQTELRAFDPGVPPYQVSPCMTIKAVPFAGGAFDSNAQPILSGSACSKDNRTNRVSLKPGSVYEISLESSDEPDDAVSKSVQAVVQVPYSGTIFLDELPNSASTQ